MHEIVEALKQLEKEKGISQEVIMEAIENSLVAACKRDFGKADNVKVSMDRETAEISVFAEKTGNFAGRGDGIRRRGQRQQYDLRRKIRRGYGKRKSCL